MREHILIIDDDEQFVKQISHFLIDAEFDVTSMSGDNDLEKLLDKVFQISPDLILSDISMVPNGFELLSALKRDSRLRMTPFIFITGVNVEDNMIKAYSGGVDNYIVKPIQYEELIVKVKAVMDRQKEMSEAMYLDPLTGIYNRRYFNQELKRQIKLHERHGDEFTLGIIDLDYFKLVNDKYGHTAGDRCLVSFSQIVLDEIRSTDIFARWGGEEFVLILERARLKGSVKTMNKILERIKSHTLFTVKEDEVRISFSAGLSQYPVHATEPLELINAADQAVYAAKAAGRSCIKVYEFNQ